MLLCCLNIFIHPILHPLLSWRQRAGRWSVVGVNKGGCPCGWALWILDNDGLDVFSLNPNYFQFEFECIYQTVVEKFNEERLYKSARSTQRYQKQQIWGWCVISMKLGSFRLFYNTIILVFPGRWLPTWFMWTRSSLAEDLAAQSGSIFFFNCTCYELYCGYLDLYISHFTNPPSFL